MIDMFREMRRKDRSIDKRQAVQLLEAGNMDIIYSW